ncbi:MAG: hypothetical protein JSR77_08680 [Planctomycetes bacterium]|nr:hypothetical protein [Planctomycetota bacterium]
MARRIAPNLRNTLADPAEYELRLFYRGHESLAKGAAAPADDPNDKRPKLASDNSRHGPVQYDDNYKCLWWLDEFDHKEKADQQAAAHQAAKNDATVKKAELQDAQDKIPPLKSAWENAKSAREAEENKLPPLKQKWDEEKAAWENAQDTVSREKAELKRLEDDLADAKLRAGAAPQAVADAKQKLAADKSELARLEGEVKQAEQQLTRDRDAATKASMERQAASAQADSCYKRITAGGRTPTPSEYGEFANLEQKFVEKKREAAEAEAVAKASTEALAAKKSERDDAKSTVSDSEQAVKDREKEKQDLDKEVSDKTGKINPQKKKVTDAEAAVQPAKDKHDAAEKKHADQLREIDSKKADEDEKKKKYDDAVAERDKKKDASTKADELEASTTDDAIAAAEEKRSWDDSQGATTARRKANTDDAAATSAESTATSKDKTATDKEKEATDAEAAAQQAESEAASLADGPVKTQKTDDAKKLRKTATDKRKEATDARKEADDAKNDATAKRSTATASATASNKAEKQSCNEPEPVKINTEILPAAKNKKYRVLITDNHAGRNGDSFSASKPAAYTAHAWMKHVVPAIPFEVELRKKADGKCLAFGANDVRVVWRIIDPPENLDIVDLFQGAAKPKTWLTRFFKDAAEGYSNKTLDPESRNDNCEERFGGLRTDGGQVFATKAFKKYPFNTGGPVAIDAAPAGGGLGVTPVAGGTDSDNNLVGLSRLFFCPKPIGGDNYQFRISLIDAEDKPVKFRDGEGKLVEYIDTGIFTVWRRTVLDIVATFASVDQACIKWNDVRKSYLPAFTEIVGPVYVRAFSEAEWKTTVKDYFTNYAGNIGGINAAVPLDEVNGTGGKRDAYTQYNLYLLPNYDALLPVVHPGNVGYASQKSSYSRYPGTSPGDADNVKYDILADGTRTNLFSNFKMETRWTHIQGLARKFLDQTYTELKRDNPRAAASGTTPAGIDQLDSLPGLAAFLAKCPAEVTDVLGEYIWEREFQFVERGDVTETFAHEFGHAVFLAHSWTRFGNVGATGYTHKVEGDYQCIHHDQADSIPCIMAYENRKVWRQEGTHPTVERAEANPVIWHFCAVCLLKLRFWDLDPMLARTDILDWIMEGLGPTAGTPIEILKNTLAPLAAAAPYDAIAKSGNLMLYLTGQAEPTVNNSGRTLRKLLNHEAARRLSRLTFDITTGLGTIANKGANLGAVVGLGDTATVNRVIDLKVTCLADTAPVPTPTASGHAFGSTAKLQVNNT